MIYHYLLQTIKSCCFDQNLHIQLCVALSNAYTDLNGDPKTARKILEDLLAQLRGERICPQLAAKINLGLGKIYRYACRMHVGTTRKCECN